MREFNRYLQNNENYTVVRTQKFLKNFKLQDLVTDYIKTIEHYGIKLVSKDNSLKLISRNYFELSSENSEFDSFCFSYDEADDSYNLFKSGNNYKKLKFISPIIFYEYLSEYLDVEKSDILKYNNDDIDENLFNFLESINYRYFIEKKFYSYSSMIFTMVIGKISLEYNWNIDKEILFSTINKWFIDKINQTFIDEAKNDSILLINIDKVSAFFNQKCFNNYNTKIIKKSKYDDNLIIYYDNNKYKIIKEKENKKTHKIQEITIVDKVTKEKEVLFNDINMNNANYFKYKIASKNSFEYQYIRETLIRDYNCTIVDQQINSDIFLDYNLFFKNRLYIKYKNKNFRFINYNSLYKLLYNSIPKETSTHRFYDIDKNYLINLYNNIISHEIDTVKFFQEMNILNYNLFFEKIIINLVESLKESNYSDVKSLYLLFFNTFRLTLNDKTYLIYYKFLSFMIDFLKSTNNYNFIKIFDSLKIYLINNYIDCREIIKDYSKESLNFFIKELNSLSAQEIKSNEIDELSKFLNIKNIELLSFSIKLYLQRSEEIKDIENNLIRYLKDPNGADENYIKLFNIKSFKNNLSLRFLLLTKSIYLISRWHIYNNKWYKNNIFIESLINISEEIIDYYISNKNFHFEVYHRLMSLISAKNALKIRYCIDNNKDDIESILEKNLFEVRFILDNNYHLVDKAAGVKGIIELTKIQNAYNFFKIPKNLESIYDREMKKLIVFINGSYKSFGALYKKIFGIYSYFGEISDITDAKIQAHKNRFAPDFELGLVFEAAFIFKDMNNIVYSTEHIKSPRQPELALDFLEKSINSWNEIEKLSFEKNLPDNSKIIIKNNNIGFNYVYDV